MPSHRNFIILLIALIGSLILNAFLAFAIRHYYIAAKLRSVEPIYAHRYSQQNSVVGGNEGHPVIVLFGDSRTANWSPLPLAHGYDIVNRGIGGETTTQMLYRFQSDVVALRPKLVIIQAGINDLVAAGLSPEMEMQVFRSTISNLAAMVVQAKSSGIGVVLLTIIPPATPGLLRRFVWSDRIAPLVEEANRQLALLHAPPSVHVIDTQRVLQTASGSWKSNVSLDTLHLTPAGYAELNSAVVGVLTKH